MAAPATVITTIGVSALAAADESAALLPFRWALVTCALFSVAGSLIAALTVRDGDAAPSRRLAQAIKTSRD